MPGGLTSLVYGDRLWDRNGAEWSHEPDQWADRATAERLCQDAPTVAVYRADDHAVHWVAGNELWGRIRDHYAVGRVAVTPNAMGETFRGQVWHHSGQEMFAVQIRS